MLRHGKHAHSKFLSLFSLITDKVCVNYQDETILREECEEARRLGYDGKQAIHPNQVSIIQSTFVPTEKGTTHPFYTHTPLNFTHTELLRASKIIAQMERSHASSTGAFGLDVSGDGKNIEMIDAPLLKQVRMCTPNSVTRMTHSHDPAPIYSAGSRPRQQSQKPGPRGSKSPTRAPDRGVAPVWSFQSANDTIRSRFLGLQLLYSENQTTLTNVKSWISFRLNLPVEFGREEFVNQVLVVWLELFGVDRVVALRVKVIWVERTTRVTIRTFIWRVEP